MSLVDGYNIPMKITNNVGCDESDCSTDLGPDCKWIHGFIIQDKVEKNT